MDTGTSTTSGSGPPPSIDDEAATPQRRLRRLGDGISAVVTAAPWTALVGFGVFAVIAGLVIAAPLVTSYDPTEQVLLDRLQSPSANHWLGTDHLGRDVMARLLYGGRFSLAIAAITVVVSATAGAVIGAISGYVGGIFDDGTMRIVDLLVTFPEVIVALLVVTMLGPGLGTLIIALSVTGWTPYARLVRGVTLSIKTQGYMEAARALGCSHRFVIGRHVLPNALKPILALTFLRFGHKLIAVGALSYLGLGVQPPDSDWGAMLADAQPYMQRVASLILAPGLAIFLSALAITLVGQGISIMLDPKLRSIRRTSRKAGQSGASSALADGALDL